MKERPSYEPLPQELISQAASTDITAYLMARDEQLIPDGRSYRLAAHDSLVITGSMFNWNKHKGEGVGKEFGNAIHFLRAYYGMGFREAVFELTGSGVGEKIDLPPPAEPPRPFNFAQIELAPNTKNVFAYLTKTRGLSPGLVNGLIEAGQLFQELEHNNAVFPIYENNTIVGAEVVGSLSDLRFKRIKTGSKYGCGYNLTYGNEVAFSLFFESVIDLLSFVDLAHMRGKGLEGCRLTSLAGLKQNIFDYTMKQLPDAQPFLCVDNDEAGQKFIAANSGATARLPDPAFKDWNEQLLDFRKK